MGKSARYEYAEHCAEQAAYFEAHQGKPDSGLLKERLEYYAIDTAFSLIESVTFRHDFNMHEIKLFVDEADGSTTLAFPSGQEIQRTPCTETDTQMYCVTKQLSNPLDTLDAVMVELDDLGSDSNINFD